MGTVQPLKIANTNGEVEIYHCGVSASGDDFKYYDFPKLSPEIDGKVNILRRYGSLSLKDRMKFELNMFAGKLGNDAAHHFAFGAGKTMEHKPGDPLSDIAMKSDIFKSAYKKAIKQIEKQFKAQAQKGTIDCSKIKMTNLPHINFSLKEAFKQKTSDLLDKDRRMIGAIVGDTQEVRIFLSDVSVDIAKRKVSGRIRWVIYDDFGVDENDLYSRSLIAFWILQHERAGYRPFVIIITILKDFTLDI